MTRSPLHSALEHVTRGGTFERRQAYEIMSMIMSGEADDIGIAALLGMLHLREETVDELVGFAQAMRDHAVRVEAPGGAIDTCGTGGDGAGTFNISTCAAFVAVGAGATVAKHGNRAVSSSCGSADVLEALGGALADDAATVEESLARSRFAFLFAPAFHPAMRHVAPVRRALGIRTAFNYLGPIVNPAGVRRQVIGVSDARAADRIAQVCQQLEVEHVLVVHGLDGLDELGLEAPARVHDVRPSGITTSTVVATDMPGLAAAPTAALVGGDSVVNAAIMRRVLAGDDAGPARDVVVFNAAAALVVADRADDLASGVELAAASIDDGSALTALEQYLHAGADGEVAA
jgi:anthranilate phosphoribosyltransferase